MIFLYFALRALVQTLSAFCIFMAVLLIVIGYIRGDWQGFILAVICAQIGKSGIAAMEDDE